MRTLCFAVLFLASSSLVAQQSSNAPATPDASGQQTSSAPATSTPSAQSSNQTDKKDDAQADAKPASDSSAKPDASKGDAKTADTANAKDAKKDGSSDTQKADSIPSPGENLDPHIKKGSEEDVNAVGQRNIGGRGLGNWYSTNWEIGTGKQYSMELERSSHLVTDPVVVEYVNRIGQNIVKN